jgi:hypothetical protein
VGIQSTNFAGIYDSDIYLSLGLYIVPEVRVGESYHYNMRDDWLGKIASAEVLEPMGKIRSNSNQRRRRKTGDEEKKEAWPAGAKPRLSQ